MGAALFEAILSSRIYPISSVLPLPVPKVSCLASTFLISGIGKLKQEWDSPGASLDSILDISHTGEL